jgi:hypothetical protein
VFLTALSGLFAIACIVASLTRLSFVVAPAGLDPALLLRALRATRDRSVLRTLLEATRGQRGLEWAHELFAALIEDRAPAREALLSERLTDLDARAARWARVPRVCASIASSAGFLCGSLVIVQSLGVSSASEGNEDVHSTLTSALNAVALGIAGAAFAIAVHVRARPAAAAWAQGMDRLIARLRVLAGDVEA